MDWPPSTYGLVGCEATVKIWTATQRSNWREESQWELELILKTEDVIHPVRPSYQHRSRLVQLRSKSAMGEFHLLLFKKVKNFISEYAISCFLICYWLSHFKHSPVLTLSYSRAPPDVWFRFITTVIKGHLGHDCYFSEIIQQSSPLLQLSFQKLIPKADN